jgi:hypothetical protein
MVMIKEEIAPGIIVYDNVIPDSDIIYEKIRKAMMSSEFMRSRWTYAEADDIEKQTGLNLNTIFSNYFNPIEKDYKDYFSIFPEWHDVYGIMKYTIGQEFINHIDDGTEYHRRVSAVYYLNDNYEGGEINFPRFNVKLKPKANQMVLFPSTYVYNHSVSAITNGEKYSVVSWLR